MAGFPAPPGPPGRPARRGDLPDLRLMGKSPCLIFSCEVGTGCRCLAKKILEKIHLRVRNLRFAEGQFDACAPNGHVAQTIRHRRCMSWHHDIRRGKSQIRTRYCGPVLLVAALIYSIVRADEITE